jgi:hypothetical protein
MTFSYALPTWGYYGPDLVPYICRGSAKFSAKPR